MRLKSVLILLFFVLLTVDSVAQCAMCRAVLESASSQDAAQGINNGIVYLMIFPYLLVGGVAYWIWRTRRKKKTS